MPAGSGAKRERQYEHIKEGTQNIEGRSSMNKDQLRKAVGR